MADPIKFSLSKKASNVTKRTQDDQKQEEKEYIRGIAGNEVISVEPQKKSDGPRVIPLIEQGQTKRSKPTPSSQKQDQSKPAESESTGAKSLDEIAVEELVKDATDQNRPVDVGRTVPLTVQNQIEGIEDITDEEERFKYDLNSRPDEANIEAYDEMPIDEFGHAMLRGMGWTPGAAIGLNNRGLVEPIEFVKRAGYRLGLGATPKDIPIKEKKYIKPGESREPPPIMVAPTGPDGKVRHVKGISEKLVPLKKQGLQSGQLVGVVSGPHEGLYARIVSAGEEDDIVVRLESSSEDVVVSKSDVSLVDQSKLAGDHPALRFMMENRVKDRERDEIEETESAYYKKEKDRHESSSSKEDSSSGKTWIRPRIMARVVSKSLQSGKYYNKKVRILDVVGRNKCIIQLDNGTLVEGVKQRMLETVIPKPGGKVMVVEGENKGKIGTLLEQKKSGNKDYAVVQLMGDLTIETFCLDDVAQYVGTFEEEAVDLTV